jgi:hypothetical protein
LFGVAGMERCVYTMLTDGVKNDSGIALKRNPFGDNPAVTMYAVESRCRIIGFEIRFIKKMKCFFL